MSLLLGYYGIWLPGFPEHAALQANWEINWRAEWSTIVYAYGPVAAIAVIWLKSRSFRLTRDEQFLLVIVAVSFGLTIHDRFVSKPIQPLHFSRGYTWMPLFLVAAPQLQKLFDAVRRVDHRTRWLIWSTGICLAVFDNVAFSLTHSYWQFNASGLEGFLLARDDRAVLESLRTADNPVVFCESLDLSYLMPTYVPTRPWLCHEFNTPDYIIRQQLLRPALAGNSFNPALIPSEIDVVVLKASRSSDVLQQSPDWQPLQTSGKTWQVWTRSKWP